MKEKESQLIYVLAGRAGLFVKVDFYQTCKPILGLYLNCKPKTGFR